MDWPVMVDSLNLLGVSAVPITMFIDESGVIRAIRPQVTDIQGFLERNYEESTGATAPEVVRPDLAQLEKVARQGNPEALRTYGNAVLLWYGISRIGQAIEAYQQALFRTPNHGSTHFRLGVAYRKRYDSDERKADDFKKAVEHWGKALDIDPNQYIWHRRIQQYGPRLDKPYPFYDWVTTARRDIETRGETPVSLSAEPGGAEFASPARSFEPAPVVKAEPDTQGRILRDEKGFIKIETTVVPSAIRPGASARVHVVFRPNSEIKAHWNNEVDDLVFWLHLPDGWQADSRYLTVSKPPQAVSWEIRKVEFELKSPANFTDSVTIQAYALYYVCEDVNGTCLYRRQDVPVQVELKIK